jgi:hypothetical protein
MQRMGYTKGPSVSSASKLEAFDRIFDRNLGPVQLIIYAAAAAADADLL